MEDRHPQNKLWQSNSILKYEETNPRIPLVNEGNKGEGGLYIMHIFEVCHNYMIHRTIIAFLQILQFEGVNWKNNCDYFTDNDIVTGQGLSRVTPESGKEVLGSIKY